MLQGSSLCAPRLRACLRGSQPPSTSHPAACSPRPPAQALWAYGYQAPTSVTAHAGAAFNAAGVPLHVGATLLFPCGGRAHFARRSAFAAAHAIFPVGVGQAEQAQSRPVGVEAGFSHHPLARTAAVQGDAGRGGFER